MRSRAPERGSATVWSLLAIVLVLLALGAALAVGAAVLARHRAGAAADLAALTAAARATAGEPAPCAAAAAVAAANGAVLLACTVDPGRGRAEVHTGVPLPGWLAPLGPARGRARAGPAGQIG